MVGYLTTSFRWRRRCDGLGVSLECLSHDLILIDVEHYLEQVSALAIAHRVAMSSPTCVPANFIQGLDGSDESFLEDEFPHHVLHLLVHDSAESLPEVGELIVVDFGPGRDC